MDDLIDLDDFPEPFAPGNWPVNPESVGMIHSNFLSKEKALSIAAWSGNVSASQAADNPFGCAADDIPLPNYPILHANNNKENNNKNKVQIEDKNDDDTGTKNDGKNKVKVEENSENKMGQFLVADRENPNDIKDANSKPADGRTTPTKNNMKPVEPKHDIDQGPRDSLYHNFGIVDPESRAGRRIAAFYQTVEHYTIEELKGAYNYRRWTDKVLNSIPTRCRQIIEKGETKCPMNDPEARLVWDALNEYLYRYIHRSLSDGVALATIIPDPRSAYKLWENLYVRYGMAATEIETRELIAMLVRLNLTKANRQQQWVVRDILARLVKAGHDLDHEQLKVMFHRGVPEYQRIEVALDRSPLLEEDASDEAVERLLRKVYSSLPE